MTVHAQKLLTPEEFASLIEIAVTSPDPHIPLAHMTKLVALGYVALTAKGPRRDRRRVGADYRERIVRRVRTLRYRGRCWKPALRHRSLPD
jgi:hypothetical protein